MRQTNLLSYWVSLFYNLLFLRKTINDKLKYFLTDGTGQAIMIYWVINIVIYCCCPLLIIFYHFCDVNYTSLFIVNTLFIFFSVLLILLHHNICNSDIAVVFRSGTPIILLLCFTLGKLSLTSKYFNCRTTRQMSMTSSSAKQSWPIHYRMVASCNSFLMSVVSVFSWLLYCLFLCDWSGLNSPLISSNFSCQTLKPRKHVNRQ